MGLCAGQARCPHALLKQTLWKWEFTWKTFPGGGLNLLSSGRGSLGFCLQFSWWLVDLSFPPCLPSREGAAEKGVFPTGNPSQVCWGLPAKGEVTAVIPQRSLWAHLKCQPSPLSPSLSPEFRGTLLRVGTGGNNRALFSPGSEREEWKKGRERSPGLPHCSKPLLESLS